MFSICFRTIIILCLFFIISISNVFSQDNQLTNCLNSVNGVLNIAREENASTYAPRNYQKGMEILQDAKARELKKNKIDIICKKTLQAENYFSDSIESAKMAQMILSTSIISRQNAANVNAEKLANAIWSKAERSFDEAIRNNERGNSDRSKALNEETTILYEMAELVAIKNLYLNSTRTLIANAEELKASRYAPITLEKAKNLLRKAEDLLDQNRYETEVPLDIVKQANYEAKRTIYLATLTKDIRDKEMTVERLILNWEKTLIQIASAADIAPVMVDGYSELEQQLTTYILNLQHLNNELIQDKQVLIQDQKDNLIQLADMEEEIRALDRRLGGATAEKEALIQRLEAQARIKEQFEKVEKMFNSKEVRVFRENNNVILRLITLTFESGKSKLLAESFDLLAKVEKAIDVYPESELIIEGHTDSLGDDDFNQKLSQDRAESVLKYMVNAMRIPSYRLIATGYGETNPIANNETESGRSKNRRIDIVIIPHNELSQ
tara:strand:+ start:3514 stop:5004 length:1491 start_codon:yes stop_codon:yes gene_type:complete